MWRKQKMKKVVVVLAVLCLVGAVQATTINGVDQSLTWGGWMNVFDTGGNYLWGSGWGTADLRANYSAGVLTLQTNTNCWNPGDPYWVAGGVGNKIMEANYYVDLAGQGGQSVTFNYVVGSNTLPVGYEALGFIKVFSPSWSLDQFLTVPLTPGAASITANVPVGAGSTQVGFTIKGLVSDPAGAAAAASATIVPEPMTMLLLGLGGLLLRKKK
ncbi:MAG: PEP-CTERM sorting domain-containing protein [Planctomycetes bacterium]|nr:PEP-CTERM sorting domain-containing protein [Planctomycetota bacterium]